MIYGYARVSSKDQNLDTQFAALSKFGVDEIVHEKISGVSKQRPELDKLLDKLESGDTIVVIRMDRLGRSSRQLIELVEDFEARNINLVILDMNIDTRTPTGKFFLTIMAGFAEMERTILKEKQRNGIEIAKSKGVYEGRPKKYHKKHAGLKHAIELYKLNKYTVKEITGMTSVSRSALYRALKEQEEKVPVL
ncbi:DNA invertase Pin-like site-specific DNA recombinase [Neobacillus sp. B4I6]|uniref:recombinase family protein n=1 Tax=Neobacillus sp. B4I6 TaxID=3373925 RepID=UPI003D25D6CB